MSSTHGARRRISLCCSIAVSLLATGFSLRAAESFEIKEGDRLLLLGDTLLERENSYGYLEARMHEQFPDRKFSVRNLSWAGETPKGISRASFDPAEKGFERLKEQIALVKPSVVVLGFGMAASLQEMTDRSQDWTLNPDPSRYGAEAMNPGRFKREMGELMDALKAENAGMRFVLLSPIRHEDVRATHPGSPDPAAHNRLLAQYAEVIRELATERNARFVDLLGDWKDAKGPVTENGIHLSGPGNGLLPNHFAEGLGWGAPAAREQNAKLSAAILRKNALWFHRTRPANETYLFGFRKHEQGQNAKEIPEFDPLIEQVDAEIDKLKRAKAEPARAEPVVAKSETAPTLPAPTFDLGENLEISLWAENPLLVKPTQMNWDALGRLWVCGTAHYPMIAPGEIEKDQIFLLEDTNGDGKADKSTAFAGGMLMPTCIVPDLNYTKDGKAQSGCYVGASTELLKFEDTDGDGVADVKRIVFTGFGTEDTHHNVHTLKWGPEGRLYFDQSVYTHTHLETPWGMVRLNAGGVFAYDPQTERVEVLAKGLWNPWGHVIDAKGQHFLTDGAGRDGIAWAFPGAIFAPSEGARQTMPLISPGTYPKFAGLELIHSPHFPDDWQNSLVTCDFRAHRIVRFKLNDLGPEKSGFVTQEMPDLARTADLTFRPIDAKLGPDGALYLADWTNPVINHGEVDFRDPRRDKTHGRIWRITYKGRPTVKWEPVLPTELTKLQARAQSKNTWEASQATRLWQSTLNLAYADRLDGDTVESKVPRERLEGMRALAKTPSVANADRILKAAVNAPSDDPYYAFAAWRSVNDVAPVWVDAVLKGEWKSEGREKELEFALRSIEPALAGQVLAQLVASGKAPLDGSGPWFDLVGLAGSARELRVLWDAIASGKTPAAAQARGLDVLVKAAQTRNLRPEGDLKPALEALRSRVAQADLAPSAVRLLGLWKLTDATAEVAALVREGKTPQPVRNAAFDALRAYGDANAVRLLDEMTQPENSLGLRRHALAILIQTKFDAGFKRAPEVLRDIANADEALQTWRALLAVNAAPNAFAKNLPKGLSEASYAAGLKAARELARKGQELVAVLTPLAGTSAQPAAPADYSALVQETQASGDPAAGEEVYRRISLACTTCHAVGGAGGKVGPELGTIGASAPLDYIIESILNPNAKVKEGYNAVSLTQVDGNVSMGIPVRESSNDIVIRTAAGQEQTIAKELIKTRDNLGSIMPPGLTEQLKPRERINLYAFLSQLGKKGVYDASRGHIARTWWISDKAPAVGASAKVEGMPVLTNVDGRLPRERMTDLASMFANATALYANAKITVAGATKTKLNLAGVSEAWLDGAPLAVASEPSPSVDLSAGNHLLTVKLNPKSLPEILRAEAAETRFLTE